MKPGTVKICYTCAESSVEKADEYAAARHRCGVGRVGAAEKDVCWAETCCILANGEPLEGDDLPACSGWVWLEVEKKEKSA